MEYLEISLIVLCILFALIVAATVAWCLAKRCQICSKEEKDDYVWRSLPHIHRAIDVEAQRSSDNVNNYWHQPTNSSFVHSSNLRQQSLPQQTKPQLNVSQSVTKHQPVNVVQPSRREQRDSSSGQKKTEYATLDLHDFRRDQAMDFFKVFLNDSIIVYKENKNSRKYRFIEVITGRGKHSPDGIPVIKPAVENYLIKHQFKYIWANPGRVRIDFLHSNC